MLVTIIERLSGVGFTHQCDLHSVQCTPLKCTVGLSPVVLDGAISTTFPIVSSAGSFVVLSPRHL